MSENRNEPGTQLRTHPGYYPGFSTLAQQGAWDEATRRVVVDRVENVPQIRYFDAGDARFWALVFDHLIPQSDRTPDRRIALVNVLDERLYTDAGVGYRFADMPTDREVYRRGRIAIDDEARAHGGTAFSDAPYAVREATLAAIHAGKPLAAPEIWREMSVHRFWQLILTDASEAYYSHPWAWDEIGFGGPSYPRAYMRLEHGLPEPWEVRERRYDWSAPAESLSDVTEETGHLHSEAEQNRSHGPRSSRR